MVEVDVAAGEEEREWFAVAELLMLGMASTGQLADAIEQKGVQGWDRYGRYRRFEPGSEQAKLALDFISLAFEHEYARLPDESPWELSYSFYGDGYRYGWLRDELPVWSTVQNAPVLPARRSSQAAKSENATVNIVGALLMFIKGKVCAQGHPEFQSETQLIDLLIDRFNGFHGVTRTNLQDKFATAKKQLSSS